MEKRRLLKGLIISSAVLLLTGCTKSVSEQAGKLVEEKKYDEALALLEEKRDESGTETDEETIQKLIKECKYELGKEAYQSKDFEKALTYLEGLDYEDSGQLATESKQKVNLDELMSDLGKACDARYQKIEEMKDELSQKAYIEYVKSELEPLKKYKDGLDVGDEKLETAVQNLIKADENQLAALEKWDENLYKAFLTYLGENGNRIVAIDDINSIHRIPIANDLAKKTFDSYKEVIEAGVPQRTYTTLTFTETDRSFGYTFYEITGENNTDESFEDYSLYFEVLNRDGDLIGHIQSEGISTLRPGQKFTISANSDENEDLGALKDIIFY